MNVLRGLLLVGILLLTWCGLGLLGGFLLDLPWLWGAGLGAAASTLLLGAGPAVVRGLLRLHLEPPPGPAASLFQSLEAQVGPLAWLEAPFPYVLALPRLAVTRGLLEGPPEHVRSLARLAAASSGPVLSRALQAVLAPACILRALHAMIRSYEAARGGQGPLGLAGEGLLALARFFELPAGCVKGRFQLADRRAARESPPGAVPAALLWLAAELARLESPPAWLEALAPLGPLSLREVRSLCLLAAARGFREGDDVAAWMERLAGEAPVGSAPSHPPLADRLQALAGRGRARPLLAGLDLAVWGGLGAGLALEAAAGYLGAPLAGLGLGILVSRLWRWPPGARLREALPALWARVRPGRGLPVRLEGRSAPPLPGLLLPPGLYLEEGQGRLLLEGPGPVAAGESLVVEGWLRGDPPRLVVGSLWIGGRRRHLFPFLRRLALPAALLGLGLTWMAAQYLGV